MLTENLTFDVLGEDKNAARGRKLKVCERADFDCWQPICTRGKAAEISDMTN